MGGRASLRGNAHFRVRKIPNALNQRIAQLEVEWSCQEAIHWLFAKEEHCGIFLYGRLISCRGGIAPGGEMRTVRHCPINAGLGPQKEKRAFASARVSAG